MPRTCTICISFRALPPRDINHRTAHHRQTKQQHKQPTANFAHITSIAACISHQPTTATHRRASRQGRSAQANPSSPLHRPHPCSTRERVLLLGSVGWSSLDPISGGKIQAPECQTNASRSRSRTTDPLARPACFLDQIQLLPFPVPFHLEGGSGFFLLISRFRVDMTLHQVSPHAPLLPPVRPTMFCRRYAAKWDGNEVREAFEG